MATYPTLGEDPYYTGLKEYIDEKDAEVLVDAEALVVPTIADGDTAHAPSAEAVYEALLLKADAASTTSAMLTATEANATVTPAVLTGHTFTIPPGKTLRLTGIMVFRTAAATTGAAYGVRVAQPSGASANARGAVTLDVAIADGAVATGLRSGDNFDVAANANALVEIVGTAAVSAADHVAEASAIIKNFAAAHSTTVTVEFRSEVAASAVTAQIGTSAVGVVS